MSWLQRFAADGQLKAQFRDKGLERVKSFSWAVTADQTVAIYQALLVKQSEKEGRH